MKTNFSTKDIRAIRHNRVTHDRIARNYDTNHIEIYNPIEQKRISQSLQKAINLIETDSEGVRALDYGAGTGNITNHLLNFGFHVVAADVSSVSLEQVAAKLGQADRLQIDTVNGADLSNYRENTFDLVATYSVLHHVPDYPAIIDEFARVLKPGGVMYLDHEACPSYWEFSKVYRSYLEELGDPFLRDYLLTLDLPDNRKGHVANLVTRLKKALATGKLTGTVLRGLALIHDEGDIHVTKDDHILWEDIKSRLRPSCQLLLEEDYLICRERTDPAQVWARWLDKAVDMRMLVARKAAVPAGRRS